MWKEREKLERVIQCERGKEREVGETADRQREREREWQGHKQVEHLSAMMALVSIVWIPTHL